MNEHPSRRNKMKRMLSMILMCCMILQGIYVSTLSAEVSEEPSSSAQETTQANISYDVYADSGEVKPDEEIQEVGNANETEGFSNSETSKIDSENTESADIVTTTVGVEATTTDVKTTAIDEETSESVEDIDVVISTDMKYAFANKDELVFHVEATGGKAPLSRYYEIYCDEKLVEGKSLEGDTITYMPKDCGTYTLRVSVTDALGSTVGTEYTIPVAIDEKETSSEWTASMQDVVLTEDYASNLVRVAKSQLEYKESDRNFIIDDEENQKGYTRYGDWYGTPYEDWNVLFVNFCIYYAELPEEYFISGSDSTAWKEEKTDLYIDDEENYTPKAGDLIFFHESDSDETLDANCPTKMGIVERVDVEKGKIYTIEGDVDDSVSEQDYSINDETIVGYVKIQSVENKTELAGEEENSNEMILAASLESEGLAESDEDAEERPLITITGQCQRAGDGYKLTANISDWNGNADKDDKMTGVLEKCVDGEWVTVTEFNGKKMNECKYESSTISSASEILNVAYRYRFTGNTTQNKTYEPNVFSEEFFAADCLKDGFRKWALDVYPQMYNNDEPIESLADLQTAYAIYSGNNTLKLEIKPEEKENLLGNIAAFDITFSAFEDMKKGKTILISLIGDNGVDITKSAEAVLATSDLSNSISINSVSNGMISMTLLGDISKNTEVTLIYNYKVSEDSSLGAHTLYGQITYDSKKTGEDMAKYEIVQPTTGWLLREVELQTSGDILPKREDSVGTEVTYKLTLANYGDSSRTIKKLVAQWDGGSLSEKLLNDLVLPAATVAEDGTRTPGLLEVTCSFEAPLSYESVENITFTVIDSIRDSKNVTTGLKLKQDGTYWLVTGDSTVTVEIDDSDKASFGTISASVVDNLDERTGADININGKIQYFDEDAGKWVTVTGKLSSPTSGTFSKVNVGSGFTAVFDATYLTVDNLLNTKYRFIANGANQKSGKEAINYSDDDNAEDINASQPFYLVDKLEKSGFRDWVLDQANGYDTASMSLDDLAEAYKSYSRIGLNVDVVTSKDGYEAGFDAAFNLTLSADSALKSNSDIRVKLSDISENMTSDELIAFIDNLKVEEDSTDYVQSLTTEGDEIVIKMAKMLPIGSALHLTVTSALEFADAIGEHTISAHAIYKEDNVIKLEDTDTGDLKVVSPSGWHIVSITEPEEAVYPGDDVYYTITFKNFEEDAVSIPTENIKALLKASATELSISEYKDSNGNLIEGNVVLPGNESVSVRVKVTSPVGSEATGNQIVQFCAADTEGNADTKNTNIEFANAEIVIEPSVTYDSSTGEYTVKLICKDLYGANIDLHSLSWDSKDTENDGNWETIGTQTITPTGSGKNLVYVDKAEFVMTDENLEALESKADSSVILYRLNDTVSGTAYYSSPVYFDNLQDLKDSAKLMVELSGKIGYSYDEFMTILGYLYYDEVAKDSKVPFSDKNSLMQYMLQVYREAGNDINAAVKVWKKYYTDMMDPNMYLRSTNHGLSQSETDFPTTKPQQYDWEDENMQYDKDEDKTASNPFHNVINSVIKGMDQFMQDGGLFSGSYFSDLSKTAVADEAGDENKERNYTIDIKANANGTYSVPTVVVFQVQTSWQMFDLDHANQVNGPKGSPCTVTDMATLYDIKHAMIDFAEYMKENGDGSVCFAITDVEHAGTFSLIGSPYFTNDMDNLISGLEQWDIFGNCEHVHYTSAAYTNAVQAITSDNFASWKDGNGNSIFENAKKVSVVIGGSTENSNGKDGYGCVTPDVGGKYLDYLYTIRCNSGTASPYLSWLDNAGMTNLVEKYNGIAFKDVTSREQLVSVFKSILQNVGKLGKVKAATNVVLEDTIENEFSLLEDSIQLVTYDFDGNPTVTDRSADDESLVITENADGTTTIQYLAGTVDYGGTVHLRFKVQAKEDYIGSNNVKTNVDVPTLEYKNDLYGSVTAQMKFTDEPKVNVPVRYNIEDGGTKEVVVNTEVNLWDELDAEKIIGKTGEKDGIEDWASGSGQDYDQINGTVTYQWEIQKLDDNGNPVLDDDGNAIYEAIGGSASVHVTNGQADGEYPDLNTKYIPQSAGTYKFRLKTTFTPDDKTNDWSETNDDQVQALVSYGYVTLDAKDNVGTATVQVIKNIDNYNEMSDGFGSTKFTVSVCTADGTSVVSKDLLSYEQHKTDENIADGTVEFKDEAKLELSELTQDDRALKFEFKALKVDITDKDGNVTSTTYSADSYSLNDEGKLVDSNGNAVQISIKAGDTVKAEFVNTFVVAVVLTGVSNSGHMKWILYALVIFGLSGSAFLRIKRKRKAI